MGNRVISQIKIGNEIFDIRDKIGPDGALHLLGVNDWQSTGHSTHMITDGGSQTPIINGTEVPLSALHTGDVVLQDKSASNPGIKQEFLWIQTNETTYAGQWELLGDEGSYVIHGSYYSDYETVTGSVFGAHTFTGKSATIGLSGTVTGGNFTVTTTEDTSIPEITWSDSHNHTVSFGGDATDSGHKFQGKALTTTLSFTPKVTINIGDVSTDSSHTFKGQEATIKVTGTIMTGVQDHSYTPGGTITIGNTATNSGHAFSGEEEIIVLSLNKSTVTSTGTYTPGGSISTPTLNLTPTPGSAVSNVAMTTTGGILLGTVAANSEVLELFNLSSSTMTVVTGITGAVAQPKFSGTAKTVTVTSSSQYVYSHDPYHYTPYGDIKGSHTFTGTATTLEHTPTTSTATLSGPYTPTGTITGLHRISGQTTTVTFTITPDGDVVRSHIINTETVTFSKRLIAAMQNLALTAEGHYTPEGTVTASGSEASGHTLSMNSHRHTVSLEGNPH